MQVEVEVQNSWVPKTRFNDFVKEQIQKDLNGTWLVKKIILWWPAVVLVGEELGLFLFSTSRFYLSFPFSHTLVWLQYCWLGSLVDPGVAVQSMLKGKK